MVQAPQISAHPAGGSACLPSPFSSCTCPRGRTALVADRRRPPSGHADASSWVKLDTPAPSAPPPLCSASPPLSLTHLSGSATARYCRRGSELLPCLTPAISFESKATFSFVSSSRISCSHSAAEVSPNEVVQPRAESVRARRSSRLVWMPLSHAFFSLFSHASSLG